MSRRFEPLVASLAVALLVAAAFGQSLPPARPAAGVVTIVGSVVDASLTPLAGVDVILERLARVEARTKTDATGTYRFTAVAPGAVRVRAELNGFPSLSRDVQVPARTTTIQLPLVMSRPQDEVAKAASEVQHAANASTIAGVPVPPSGQRPAAQPSRAVPRERDMAQASAPPPYAVPQMMPDTPRYGRPQPNREGYAHVDANRFQFTRNEPLSTFGADVDTASYTNVRRFLSQGQLPPADAVRIEELINYFRFDYPEPRGADPIGITAEIGDAPWAPLHKLVLIGARARASAPRETSGRNIVLLIDVSGSMAPPERLPLLKAALSMFADTLRPDDRLAIVTYAGSSGVALPSTPGRRRQVIQDAIAGLGAGGSTNGAQGIITAYRVAREAYIPGGVNRVILATDGDFNVGVVSQQGLFDLIDRERRSGVFLSVLGVGSGNLQDATMEMLADKGNGHYAYIDSMQEARRVLIREGDSTLETVAKDVKFQVEFNPALVASWKLIGYENRLMAAEHFNDDRKDGGEMGAGHTVTVLYELIPVGVSDDGRDGRPAVDPLKYQEPRPAPRRDVTHVTPSGEWLTVKARYKAPEGEVSELVSLAVRSGGAIRHLPLASALAEFGLLLRDDRYDGSRWTALSRRVAALSVSPSLSADKDGFAEMVEIAKGTARAR